MKPTARITAEELATLEGDLNENKEPGGQPRTALQTEH